MSFFAAPKKAGRLTETEACAIGTAAFELRSIRDFFRAGVRGACLDVRTERGAKRLWLTDIETEAVLALLAERHTLFLTHYDVDLEEEEPK